MDGIHGWHPRMTLPFMDDISPSMDDIHRWHFSIHGWGFSIHGWNFYLSDVFWEILYIIFSNIDIFKWCIQFYEKISWIKIPSMDGETSSINECAILGCHYGWRHVIHGWRNAIHGWHPRMEESSMVDIHGWHFHPWMTFLHPWMTSMEDISPSMGVTVML